MNGKVHWIMEDEMTLSELYQHKFCKDHIQLVDITGREDIEEGWDYDGVNFTPPVVKQPTPEEIMLSIVNATQARLDTFAKTRNYDSILSACSYATSKTIKFQVEGQYCVEIREATWNKLYEILAQVEAGTRVAPTSFTDIEAELPALAWPVV